jgi:excisionase family DNA binding protein
MAKREDLMTKPEVMEYLRISRQTLQRLMRKHAFPFIKFEKKVLFKRSDIDKYLEAHIVK